MNRLSVGSVLAVPLELTVCDGGLCAALAFVDAGEFLPGRKGAGRLMAKPPRPNLARECSGLPEQGRALDCAPHGGRDAFDERWAEREL
jgi:hypothetical protein